MLKAGTRRIEPVEDVPASNRDESNQIRIVIVERFPLLRHGLIGLLGAQPGFRVTAEYDDCDAFCERFSTDDADLAVVDLETVTDRGLAKLRRSRPQVRSIGYAAYQNDWQIVDAIKAGLHGYFTKTSPVENALDAVRAVSRGEAYLDPAVASKVMGELGRKDERRRARTRRLTERETSIMRSLAEGKRNKHIARKLCISEHTVKFHVSALLRKFNASNRTELVSRVAEHGFIGPKLSSPEQSRLPQRAVDT